MKKLFLCVLALAVCASAADNSLGERVDGLQAQIERVAAKAGIQFSGEFRSGFLNSTVSGEAVGDGKKGESAEYTSVDFDIVARPNTALSARVMFRLHQDWRNFFSDVQNPITTRWISIDGSFMDGIIKYNFGDYQKKLTPLTLWAPDFELLYEPEIFAQGRKLAMSEVFLGDNNRALQGMNVGFRAGLDPLLYDVTLDLFGARLATRGTGESGIAPPPGAYVDGVPNGDYWSAKYDKYLTGVNLSVEPVEGAMVGISNITIFDYEGSYGDKVSNDNVLLDSVNAKLNSNFTNVFAGRLGADNRLFMETGFISAGLNAEFAFSSYRDRYMKDGDVTDSSITGMAMNIGLTVDLNLDEENTVKLTGSFISNDSSFWNEAAQSPTFLQRAIMNNENSLRDSLSGLGLGVMNPFDAMYRTVFKYSPSQYFGGPNPHTKNAYTNAIFDRDALAEIAGSKDKFHGHPFFRYPNVFQAALPGGMATANRSGVVGNVKGSFLDKGVTAGIKVAMVNTIDDEIFDLGSYTDENGIEQPLFTPPTSSEHMEVVGGLSVDVAKFAPVVGPSLVIGGSYGMYNASNDFGKAENSLISAELNYNFYKNFSLLAGYQNLNMIDKDSNDNETGNFVFQNIAFGVNYKVAEGGSLTFKWTILTGSNEKVEKAEYTVHQPELYLTVKF